MFDYFAERICLECVNSDDGCEPEDSSTCPFWGEFNDLAKLCETAEKVAASIKESAGEDYYGDRYASFLAGNW